MIKSSIFSFFLLIAPTSLMGQSEQLVTDSEAAILRVINTQLKAFSRGDSKTAYAQASDTIKQIFLDEHIFMRMVEKGYGVLINPISVEFLGVKNINGEITAGITLVASNYKSWFVTYQMTLNKDKKWRINGCKISPLSDQAI